MPSPPAHPVCPGCGRRPEIPSVPMVPVFQFYNYDTMFHTFTERIPDGVCERPSVNSSLFRFQGLRYPSVITPHHPPRVSPMRCRSSQTPYNLGDGGIVADGEYCPGGVRDRCVEPQSHRVVPGTRRETCYLSITFSWGKGRGPGFWK